MRISDWSSDVCSSDLVARQQGGLRPAQPVPPRTARRARDHPHAHDRDDGGLLARGRASADQLLCVQLYGPDRLSRLDRKSVVSGKSVSVRVDLGGRRIIKKKTIRKSNKEQT